jgi:hypothetical protein
MISEGCADIPKNRPPRPVRSDLRIRCLRRVHAA